MMTLGSLFDGLGGWQIAACRAGIKPVWSSEIEKFPLKLTSIRFPNTKQIGDITKLSAEEIKPVDIITMGSPCQDLSIAGKREGLAGERSGLFVTAINLVHAMRKLTNGRYPKYVIWENVTGAYTSNKGMDFKTVLEKITETSIPVPGHHKWAKSGMVRSRICTVAWRTLDAQYWGVPQRRRRIFLVADYTDGGGTEEILFKSESLSRDFTTGSKKWQGTSCEVGTSSHVPSQFVLNDQGGIQMDTTWGKANTLRAQAKHPPIVFDVTHHCDAIRINEGTTPTLTHHMGTGGNNVPLVYSKVTHSDIKEDKTAACTEASGGDCGGGSENYFLCDPKDCPTDSQLRLRRLTPLECERLQGLPDNWTLIDDKTCSDSARYKAIGNGMAQPCADFVMNRIAEHEMSKHT